MFAPKPHEGQMILESAAWKNVSHLFKQEKMVGNVRPQRVTSTWDVPKSKEQQQSNQNHRHNGNCNLDSSKQSYMSSSCYLNCIGFADMFIFHV